ncbi:MAG: hypothetical protein R3Y43_04915 [Alphaproteobacteria bacterium]
MKKIIILAILILCSCSFQEDNNQFDLHKALQESNRLGMDVKLASPINKNTIKTTIGAQDLDLEKPLRCYVNSQTQQMITSIPYNITAFDLVKNGANDPLPRFEVAGFSFEKMPASQALYKLLKEADIKLIAKDGPYTKIAAENLRGEFSEVVNMITTAADLFYTYNAHSKTLNISRKANFTLYAPKSLPITLALLDVLRGAGITDLTTDWSDYSITFDADYELKNKMMTLISYFEENPSLITYDVYTLRVYPNNKETGVDWQTLVQSVDFGTIKTAKTGVIGRLITTSNKININNLLEFLGTQSNVDVISEGKFIVPNLWLSRFDIGKCGDLHNFEAGLSLLTKTSLERGDRIFSTITLDTPEGELTKFDIRSKLGENFLIIGVDNDVIESQDNQSELVMFIVPRIIRTLKTVKHLENNM